MTGRIAGFAIGLGLEDGAATAFVDEFHPDEIAGAGNGIAPEKVWRGDGGSSHRRSGRIGFLCKPYPFGSGLAKCPLAPAAGRRSIGGEVFLR
jgi:hypothetical protein